MLPESKQVGLTIDNLPSAKSMHDAGDCVASYVFPTSPANQRLADMPLDGPERRRRKAPIVVEPPPDFGIDLPGKLLNGLPRTAMQLPSANFAPDFLPRFLQDGWTETTEDPPFPTVRFPRPKRGPEKSRTSRWGGSLADWHPCNRRFSPSPDAVPAHTDSTVPLFWTHQIRVPLCSAMDNEVPAGPHSGSDMPQVG